MSEATIQKKNETSRLSDLQWQQSNNDQVVEGEVIQAENKLDDHLDRTDEMQDRSQTDETSTRFLTERNTVEIDVQDDMQLVPKCETGLSLEEDATLSNSRETYLLSLKDDKGRKELQNELLDV